MHSRFSKSHVRADGAGRRGVGRESRQRLSLQTLILSVFPDRSLCAACPPWICVLAPSPPGFPDDCIVSLALTSCFTCSTLADAQMLGQKVQDLSDSRASQKEHHKQAERQHPGVHSMRCSCQCCCYDSGWCQGLVRPGPIAYSHGDWRSYDSLHD